MATCRIAAGKIYARDLTVANQPFYYIGNAQLNLAIAETKVDLPDYTNVAGGNACSVRDISGVELDMTMYDFDKKNLAMAVYGSYSDSAVGPAVAEPVDVFLDGITPLAHIPTGTVTLTVGAVAYTENVDFEQGPAGLLIIPGSPLAIALAAAVPTPKYLAGTAAYALASEDTVSALVTSGKTFALVVEAKNKAAGGKGEKWSFHKVQFGPTGALAIITREFGSFSVKGEVLADITQPVGESQYFTIQQAK